MTKQGRKSTFTLQPNDSSMRKVADSAHPSYRRFSLKSESPTSGEKYSDSPDQKNIDNEKRIIDMIQSSSDFAALKSAYQKTFKMPLVLCHRDEEKPVMRQPDSEGNRFCQILLSRNETCEACLVHQNRVHSESLDSNNSSSRTCPHGMVDSAVPVLLNGRTIGFLRTGQVFVKAPSGNDFADTMTLLNDECQDLQVDEIHEAYFQTKVISPDQMDGTIQLLEIHADRLSRLAQDLELAQDTLEPGIIKRTKAYIEENLDQPLSLESVSEVVHCNSFYLCKLFKKVNGYSFTEYINHQRLQKAKRLLMNQDMRISEVAMDSGFQSITHFNRVFRKYAGCSPSEFRKNHEAFKLTHQA